MSRLTIAIQKNGRLSEKSLQLLKDCGIKINNGKSDRQLKTEALNFPLDILFLRDNDIPHYVEQGVAHIGIVGENEVWEQEKDVQVVDRPGFAQCRLSLAIAKDEPYAGLEYFNGKRIATSYPGILRKFCEENRLDVKIEEIGGSVEIAPGIGLSHGIFDIVSTGSTLIMNGLREVKVVAKSAAVIIANKELDRSRQNLLSDLLFRIKAVRSAAANKYILLNAPEEAIEKIVSVLPGMKSPTVLPLALKGWVSIHSVVREDVFWETIDLLKQAGAQGILVVPIEKMIL